MINYYVFLYGSGCSYSDYTTIPYKKMDKYVFI